MRRGDRHENADTSRTSSVVAGVIVAAVVVLRGAKAKAAAKAAAKARAHASGLLAQRDRDYVASLSAPAPASTPAKVTPTAARAKDA